MPITIVINGEMYLKTVQVINGVEWVHWELVGDSDTTPVKDGKAE